MTTLPFSQRPTETPRAIHRDDARREARPRSYAQPEAAPPRTGALITAAALLAILCVLGGLWYWRELQPASPTGTLQIESDPAGAAVEVDGEHRSITPATLHLPPGRHRVLINNAGQTHTFVAHVTAGVVRTHHVRWTAPPAPAPAPELAARARLNIASAPAGGTVTVDGVERGVSPLAIDDLSPGEHVVTLRIAGHTLRRTITLAPGGSESLVFNAPMSAIAAPVPAENTGWLTVRSSTVLQIFEGGRLVGTTESERVKFPAGTHQLEFVDEALGFRTKKAVSIPAGGTAHIPVALPLVVVSLNATPWADVEIDGRATGQTPIANLSLPLGSHQVTFRHPQFGEKTATLVVSLKEPARLAVDMRR